VRLGIRQMIAVDAPQVGHDHASAQRQQVVEQPSRQRDLGDGGLGQCNRRRIGAIVRHRQRDASDPVAIAHRLGGR